MSTMYRVEGLGSLYKASRPLRAFECISATAAFPPRGNCHQNCRLVHLSVQAGAGGHSGRHCTVRRSEFCCLRCHQDDLLQACEARRSFVELDRAESCAGLHAAGMGRSNLQQQTLCSEAWRALLLPRCRPRPLTSGPLRTAAAAPGLDAYPFILRFAIRWTLFGGGCK